VSWLIIINQGLQTIFPNAYNRKYVQNTVDMFI